MLRAIAVLALLCTAVQAEVKLNFTKEYELVMNEPNFVKSGEEVIAVEHDEEFIRTSSSDVNAKKCEFKLDKEVHQIDTKMRDHGVRSWILGNGKIVVMGPRNTSESDNFNHYNIFVVHVIDPVACTKSSFTKKVAVPKNKKPSMYGSLVPYQDTFDLFFLDSPEPKCCPCRYNDKAEEIEAPFTAVRGSFELNHRCGTSFIRTIKEFDASEGYFLACSYSNATAGVKLLNSKFEVIKEKNIPHLIHDVSIAKGSETHIGVCYEHMISRENPPRLTEDAICDILDLDLKPKHTITLHADEGEYIRMVKILTLKDGSAWIQNQNSAEYKNDKGYSVRVFIRHVQADGKSSEPAEILKNFSSEVRLFPFLFKEEYCLVIRASENYIREEFPKLHVRGKCFDAATL